MLYTACFIACFASLASASHIIHPEYSGTTEEYREYLTADELLKTCQGIALHNYQFTPKSYDHYKTSRRKQRELNVYLKEYCAGYIFANAEAHDSSIAKGGWSYCLPKTISRRYIRDTVQNYLSSHDEERQYTAVSVISHAFSNAYPCTSEKQKYIYDKYTAAEFYKNCKAGNEGFCIGYIQGVADAYDNWETEFDKKFCGAGYGLTRMVLLRFIALMENTNLEEIDPPALDIMTSMIRDENLEQDKCIDRGPGPLQFLCHSADSGDTNAQYKLALYFDYGLEGLPKDPVRAYVWYEIAETKGAHMQSANRLKELRKILNKEQIMQAKELIKGWEPGWCELDLSEHILDHNE
jgi:hypothetical protein